MKKHLTLAVLTGCCLAVGATLDLFAKHGVGAIVNGVVPGWWGGGVLLINE